MTDVLFINEICAKITTKFFLLAKKYMMIVYVHEKNASVSIF